METYASILGTYFNMHTATKRDCDKIKGYWHLNILSFFTVGWKKEWTDPDSREICGYGACPGQSDSRGNTCRRLVRNYQCTAAHRETLHTHPHLQEHNKRWAQSEMSRITANIYNIYLSNYYLVSWGHWILNQEKKRERKKDRQKRGKSAFLSLYHE